MPYANLQDLTDRYGEPLLIDLTDRAEVPTGSVDTDVVDRALADTDAVIDGYLAARYALPMASVPTIITDLALQIAIYKLHIFEPGEKIGNDYKAALAMLKEIGAGVIQLQVAGIETPGTGGSGARTTDRERPMTGTTLKGFV